MKISKFKKYRSWNLISITGYFGCIIAAVFLVFLIVSGSQLNMRADLNQYFYDYIFTHIVEPYFGFYKSQLVWIFILVIISVFENRKYRQDGQFGLRIFENMEKGYSIVFVIGLILNFLPLYFVSIFILINMVKIF